MKHGLNKGAVDGAHRYCKTIAMTENILLTTTVSALTGCSTDNETAAPTTHAAGARKPAAIRQSAESSSPGRTRFQSARSLVGKRITLTGVAVNGKAGAS